METYNRDKLVKIVVNDFYPSGWYSLKKERKIFGFIIQREGIYNRLRDYYDGSVPENHILKDGVIYEVPEVILYYQGGYSNIYYFSTHKEALRFKEDITNIGNWLN